MSKINRISFKGESTNLLSQHKTGQDLATLPSTVQTHYAPQNIVAPKITNPLAVEPNKNNNTVYITSAIALASLGVTTVLAIKNGKLNKELAKLTSEIKGKDSTISTITNQINDLEARFKGSIDDLTHKVAAEAKQAQDNLATAQETLNEQIKGLGRWQDGQIEGVRKDLTAQIDAKSLAPVQAGNMQEIFTDTININGRTMRVASARYGYGKHQQTIEKILRSEATKRIFNLIDRSKIQPKEEIVARILTSDYIDFLNNGGQSMVVRDILSRLLGIINTKHQKLRMIVDMPLYLGEVKEGSFYSLKRTGEKTYDYIRRNKNKIETTQVELVDTREIPIYTDKGMHKEKVEYLLARNMKQNIDYNLLKPWLKDDLANEVQTMIKKKQPAEISRGAISFKYDPNINGGKPTVTVKYDALLQKNDRFRMDGPTLLERNKDIFTDVGSQCRETERFLYSDKYSFEQIASNGETSTDPLGADVIIANDWQSGGATALFRLMPQVRKYFGEMDPEYADKLYNTPIITLIHNAEYQGSSWDNAEKYLNILFGEHAAMIAKNAWMPKGANLSEDMHNGLFHGESINPQTMACAYSDIIIPVSEGYGAELASHSGFGRDNHHIFRMRGRFHEFGDIDTIRKIAKENGIDEALVIDSKSSYTPITNGCDRIDNLLTEDKAIEIERAHNLSSGSILTLKAKTKNAIYKWHRHNKEVAINKLKEYIDIAKKGNKNPMKIHLPELTDLEGVTADTPAFVTAGRIVDQKGLDILEKAIEKFMDKHHDMENPPLFYNQGIGDMNLISGILAMKKRLAAKYGEKAASRIVFAEVFDQKYYDMSRIMADFNIMSSWFEPCGLVHKQNAAFSGAIAIINKVGGLPAGLRNKINALFVKFMPRFDNYELALEFNSNELAKTMEEACNIFHDTDKFKSMLKSSYLADHSWLKVGGPAEKYAKVLVDLKVLKPEVLEHSA